MIKMKLKISEYRWHLAIISTSIFGLYSYFFGSLCSCFWTTIIIHKAIFLPIFRNNVHIQWSFGEYRDIALESIGYVPNINIYTLNIPKTAISSINKWGGEIFIMIGVLVINICDGTQSEKTLFGIQYCYKIRIEKIYKQSFFTLCFVTYINNQDTYHDRNCTTSFINTWYRCFRNIWCININIALYW